MMPETKFKNPASCRTFEIFQSYANAFEQAYDTDEWDAVADHFSDDICFQVLARPVTTIRTEGKENVISFFKTNLDAIDRRFPTKRQRQNISKLEVNGNYIEVYSSAIYSSPDGTQVELTYEEEAWINDQGKIKELISVIPAGDLERLTSSIEVNFRELIE